MNFIVEVWVTLIVPCLCICMGMGLWKLLYRKERSAPSPADALLTGELLLIGLAEAAHLGAVFLGRSFSDCTLFFCILLGAALLLSGLVMLGTARREPRKGRNGGGSRGVGNMESAEKVLAAVFLGLVLVQLIWIAVNAGAYRRGDMTVETVGSFLSADGIYTVNPMTGQPYSLGIPSRLKILCLPTLYGILCRLSGLEPETVVYTVVPVLVAVSSYAAFGSVGSCLFPNSRKKRYCFLIAVAILFWTGSYRYGMDGFGLLYCGYRGVSVRGLVLLPYLISLCIRRRWKPAILCILAEACITWTLYGAGAGLLLTAGLFLAGRRQPHDGNA